MGLYHSPRIVTDGLVLCLDAANTKGYDKYENLWSYSETTILTGSGFTNNFTLPAGLTNPAGGTTATKILTGTTQTWWSQGSGNRSFTSGEYYTMSWWAYSTTASVNFSNSDYFYLANTTIASQTTTTPGQWVRCYRTVQFTATGGAQVRFMPYNLTLYTDVNNPVYIWGAQLERGSSVSPYYPTTGTAKTRGTTLTDLSIGGGNNGTLVNGVGYNGSDGGSLVFDGVDDRINLPLSNNLKNTSYTIFGFVKSSVSIQNGSSEKYLYYFRGTITGSDRFGVLFGFSSNVNSNNGKLSLIIGNGGWNGYYSSRDSWSANTWYNIAVTQSGTTYKMYVNGIQTDTGTAVVPQFSGMDQNIFGTKWNGNISNGLVYNRALTAAEVQQNFNATRGRFGI